ncbi:hypothetical protein HRI_003126300 [Hibiscus trionum]|uniref:Uncharacterized protein n=1 Tax=Hibiscus trionum TaxID=183268 RepID=A0A9W7IH40_HIBTR|nr:hypothetical protein HRI_003126300 [Hibiscus trionum]
MELPLDFDIFRQKKNNRCTLLSRFSTFTMSSHGTFLSLQANFVEETRSSSFTSHQDKRGRANRTMASGYWKATGSPSYVYSSVGNIAEIKGSDFGGIIPSMNEYRAIDAVSLSDGDNKPLVCFNSDPPEATEDDIRDLLNDPEEPPLGWEQMSWT